MSAKTRPRDYGKAQRLAVNLYTARKRIAAIETAAEKGTPGTAGALTVERKREADALALLSAKAVNLNAQFLRDVGDALGVLLLNGEDALRAAPDEGHFVLRCAADSYWRQFQRCPTHREFSNFLLDCAGDETWPEAMRVRADGLSGLSKQRMQKLLKLNFAPSGQTRGKTKHGG